MTENYSAVYVFAENFESREEMEKWIDSICFPLKERYREIPDSSVSGLGLNLIRPLDLLVEKALQDNEDRLDARTITEYVDQHGKLAVREYFPERGRAFLSRDGVIEEIARENDLEFEIYN